MKIFQLVCFGIFAFIIVSSNQVRSEPACALSSMMIKDQAFALQGLSLYQLDNPFPTACPGKLTSKDRYTTNVKFTQGIPFLKKVLSRVKKSLLQSQKEVSEITECLNKKVCSNTQVQNFMAQELPMAVKYARRNLAVSLSEDPDITMLPSSVHKILYGTKQMETPNYSLNTLGLYKAQSWSKLTAQEIKQANDDLESIKKNVQNNVQSWSEDELINRRSEYLTEQEMQHFKKSKPEDIKRQPKDMRFLQERLQHSEMLVYRHQAFLNYMEIQSRYPIMQYLTSNDPTINEVAKANNQLQSNLNKELSTIYQIEEDLNQLPANSSIPASVLRILDYQPYVETELLTDSKNCTMAASMKYSQHLIESDRNFDMGFPIMVASMYASGPAVLSMLGASASGIQYDFQKSVDKNALSATKNENLLAPEVKMKKPTNKFDDVNTELQKQRDINLIVTGAGFVAPYFLTRLSPAAVLKGEVQGGVTRTMKAPFSWLMQQKTKIPSSSLLNK